MGSLAKSAKKQDTKLRLMEAIGRDEEVTGKRKTNKLYAEEFGVSERTIIRYIRELEEDI
jgi:predicted DNA-binding transcriptional regulator YafY